MRSRLANRLSTVVTRNCKTNRVQSPFLAVPKCRQVSEKITKAAEYLMTIKNYYADMATFTVNKKPYKMFV